MSILIKGMEMPTEGLVTVNIHSDGLVYVQGAYPTELYEAVYIPTPHGRLIDGDKAKEALRREEALTRAFGYHNVIDTISEAPTIIEAEEEQTADQ